MKYPVSENRCKGCSACQMVERGINFALLPEEEMYYQCIAMVEDDCQESTEGQADD